MTTTYETKQYKTLKIKYHSPDLNKITILPNGDWIDLRSAERVELKQGDFKIISLGISIKLPEGYEAHIAPRSSTFKNWGIIQVNSVGVIDSTYCGEKDIWGMGVYATRDTIIEVNDRICQFRIVEKQPSIVFEEVDFMEDVNRGGFGSTGKN